MALWLTRAGSAGEYEKKFLEDGRIYLTWDYLDSDLRKIETKDELKAKLEEMDPGGKPGRYQNWASQIWPFVWRMKKGDWVILPSKFKSVINFGKIEGDYVYDKSLGSPYYHYRKVNWFAKDIPRTNFDQDLLYSFGAAMTICRIKRNDAEFRVKEMAKNNWVSPTGFTDIENEDGAEFNIGDLEQLAEDNIAKFLQQKFKGHGMTRVIEGILKAKGYITYRSGEGPDKGVDILAAPEPFGFGTPKLCVQVKTSDTPIERSILDQLIGAMQNLNADQGLLVSWGGFRSSVEREIPAQFFRVRIWDQAAIIKELIENYDKLDEDLKAEIPLKRIWTLASPQDDSSV